MYESLKAHILTEEKMIESNYPVQHPEKLGCAVLYTDNKRGSTDGKTAVACDLKRSKMRFENPPLGGRLG